MQLKVWQFALFGLFLLKAYKFLDEKVQKDFVSWQWRVMQSLKIKLVPKMTWRTFWILMREVASLKVCTLMFSTFVESILCLSRKGTEELCVITLSNDEKFEDEMTCGLKNDMRNLSNVDPTLRSLKICSLMGFF